MEQTLLDRRKAKLIAEAASGSEFSMRKCRVSQSGVRLKVRGATFSRQQNRALVWKWFRALVQDRHLDTVDKARPALPAGNSL